MHPARSPPKIFSLRSEPAHIYHLYRLLKNALYPAEAVTMSYGTLAGVLGVGCQIFEIGVIARPASFALPGWK